MLKDLIDINVWSKAQAGFSLVAGAPIRAVNMDGSLVVEGSGLPRVCTEILSKYAADQCYGKNGCFPEILENKEVFDANSYSYSCMEGLLTMLLIPLRLRGKRVVGYLVFGPCVLVARKTQQEYSQVAEKLGCDPDELWNALLEIRVLSFAKAHGIVELVKTIGEYLIDLYDHSVRGQGGGVLAKPSVPVPESEGNFQSLLELAIQLSGADTGSLMLLDSGSDELVVRYSQGLPRDVHARARVKVGDGISGIAFQENENYILDESTRDNRLAQYMNRPGIASSMIIPCKVKGQAVGVMNLSAFQGNTVRFNAASLRSVTQLIQLGSSALKASL